MVPRFHGASNVNSKNMLCFLCLSDKLSIDPESFGIFMSTMKKHVRQIYKSFELFMGKLHLAKLVANLLV